MVGAPRAAQRPGKTCDGGREESEEEDEDKEQEKEYQDNANSDDFHGVFAGVFID